MSWATRSQELLRIEFILLAIQPHIVFSTLCEEFSISRTTGYKWLKRYREFGIAGLRNRSHRPKHNPNAIPGHIVTEIIRLRQQYPYWGAGKIRHLLIIDNIVTDNVPSKSSIGRILKRCYLTSSKGRGRPKKNIQTTPLSSADGPNDVWTVDFKGWWRTKDRKRCEPLTIRDLFSRYILCIKPLKSGNISAVKVVFEELFEKYGLPKTIRSDNGSPFASTSAPYGLTQLSAWWLLNGIKHDRTTPGKPQDNGGHERMHRDIAREIEGKPSDNIETEACRLEYWRREFNERRPHEALDMKVPADLYKPSDVLYKRIKNYIYPLHYEVRSVKKVGTIKFKGKELYISCSLAKQTVGLQRLDVSTYNVWYCNLLIGQILFSSDSSLSFIAGVQNPMKTDL